MKRSLLAILILLSVGALGFVIFRITDSQTAAYIVSLLGAGVGLAGVFLPSRSGKANERRTEETKVDIEVGEVDSVDLVGVDEHNAQSELTAVRIKLDTVKGGTITGVKRDGEAPKS